MNSVMKTLLSKLPKPVYESLRQRRRRYRERRFLNQDMTQFDCGAFQLEIPRSHLLLSLHKSQPYRDLCVGVVAKFIGAKYPDATIVDIGANIGDTAALIATYFKGKLVLVEASDYFFEILTRNVKQFPNEVIVRKTMISDGEDVSGHLQHWGGTAVFTEGPDEPTTTRTERLLDVADENTRFVKIDTDGYDVQILADSLEWLAVKHPAILFENEIKDDKELVAVDSLLDELKRIGYESFIVWDDPGFHIASTTCVEVIKDLNRYLFKLTQDRFQHSLSNFDVLCLHRADDDIYRNVHEYYMTY